MISDIDVYIEEGLKKTPTHQPLIIKNSWVVMKVYHSIIRACHYHEPPKERMLDKEVIFDLYMTNSEDICLNCYEKVPKELKLFMEMVQE